MKARRVCAVAVVGGLAVSLSAGAAEAAGFALKEQSGTALGNAFAGATAGAEDVSYMFFNPAGLTRHSGIQAAAVASLVMPQSQFEDGRARTTAPISAPITGGNGGDDATDDALVPAFYGVAEVTEDLRLGIGVNAPFGLVTDYADSWIGRYHARKSMLTTINVNPVVAYQVHDAVSLGAGLQVQYIDAELSNAIDFGTLGIVLPVSLGAPPLPGAIPTQQDGHAKVEGDDIGVGFNLGILVEPWEGSRFGVAYRSKIEHKLEGKGKFRLDSAGVGAALRAATGAFVNSDIEAETTLPETVSFGFHHDINEQWSVMGEAAWTRWSRFDELRIEFDNPAQPDSITEEDWDDSWFFAAGVTWRPDDKWTVRAGVAHDQTPVPNRTRTPRIADEDRTWLAIGGGYQVLPNFRVDFGYTHIFVDDASLSLSASDPGNLSRGDLSGEYENSIDILTVQAVYRF